MEAPSRLLNRELSWLDFNRRVLALAQEPGIPLLERLKFVAICSSNLDEFFQVRISALKDQVAAGVAGTSVGGLTPSQQLAAIGPNVEGFVIEQEKVLLDMLVPELAQRGVKLVSWDDLGADDKMYLADVFEQRIFPVLTPLAVDPAHPFPYISNLALSLAAMVSDPDTGERRFARVKVPTVFPRLVGLPDGIRFLPAEQLIAAQLHSLFVGMVVEEHAVFRVTRNVDLTLEDEEADDLLAAVEMETASSPIRPSRAGRGAGRDQRGNARVAAARARPRRQRCHGPSGVCSISPASWQLHARSTVRAEGQAVAAGDRRPDRRRRGSRPQHLLGDS